MILVSHSILNPDPSTTVVRLIYVDLEGTIHEQDLVCPDQTSYHIAMTRVSREMKEARALTSPQPTP